MTKLITNVVCFMMILLVSCQSQPKGFNLTGAIQNAANLEVMLQDVRGAQNNTLSLGKATCDKDGNFSINVPEGLTAGIYAAKVGVKYLLLVLDGKENNVKVKADLNTLDKLEYTVEGSEGTSYVISNMRDLMAGKLKPDDIKNIGLSAKNPLAGMLMYNNVFQNSQYVDLHEQMCKKVEATFPSSPYASDYRTMIARMQEEQAKQIIKVGAIAPEISLPGPDGKVRSLSALKGQVVLLDFWASWCGPCRKANPSVVALYNQYKSKGFTVFSVSLDGNADAWKQAIAQDGLVWDNHVSDLKKWQALPAKVYGINSIPQAYVIDREGKIANVLSPGMDPAPAVAALMK